MEEQKNYGICIKNSSKIVSFQNEICRNACGEMLGQICEKGCMTNYIDQRPGQQSEGMSLIKNLNVDGHILDAAIINDTEFITTILYPLKNKFEVIEQNINEFKKYNLTNSELDIMTLKLKGLSNIDISKKLFISKSTLKTHLNNIYKKIPEEWSFLKNKK